MRMTTLSLLAILASAPAMAEDFAEPWRICMEHFRRYGDGDHAARYDVKFRDACVALEVRIEVQRIVDAQAKEDAELKLLQ